MPTWKRILIKAAGFGAGLGLVLCAVFAMFVWFESRPAPPKSWKTTSLVSADEPSFDVSTDGKKLRLMFVVENKTAEDYNLSSHDQLKIVSRLADGSVSQPIPQDALEVEFPVFIPAKQRGRMHMNILYAGLPVKNGSESDAAFHERLRQFMNEEFDGFGGFSVFDETNKYQLNLPRWLPSPKAGSR